MYTNSSRGLFSSLGRAASPCCRCRCTRGGGGTAPKEARRLAPPSGSAPNPPPPSSPLRFADRSRSRQPARLSGASIGRPRVPAAAGLCKPGVARGRGQMRACGCKLQPFSGGLCSPKRETGGKQEGADDSVMSFGETCIVDVVDECVMLTGRDGGGRDGTVAVGPGAVSVVLWPQFSLLCHDLGS